MGGTAETSLSPSAVGTSVVGTRLPYCRRSRASSSTGYRCGGAGWCVAHVQVRGLEAAPALEAGGHGGVQDAGDEEGALYRVQGGAALDEQLEDVGEVAEVDVVRPHVPDGAGAFAEGSGPGGVLALDLERDGALGC